MPVKFCTLASGSKANCHFIRSNNTAILIDIGLSLKELSLRLNQINEDISNISAIFITHEHSDHIKGLKQTLKKHQIPTYTTLRTKNALADKVQEFSCYIYSIPSLNKHEINDLTIMPIPISHDAVDPHSYIVSSKNNRIGILTDVGYIDNNLENYYKGCNLLVIEANHDVEMLKKGEYPPLLKHRILSKSGHISNKESGVFLSKLLKHNNLKHILLGHLSESNNTEDKAIETVVDLISQVEHNSTVDLTYQHKISNIYNL